MSKNVLKLLLPLSLGLSLSFNCFAGKKALLNTGVIRPFTNAASVVTAFPVSFGSGIYSSVTRKDPSYAAIGFTNGVMLTFVYAGVLTTNALLYIPLVIRAPFIKDGSNAIKDTKQVKLAQMLYVPMFAHNSASFYLSDFFMLEGEVRGYDADGGSSSSDHVLF